MVCPPLSQRPPADQAATRSDTLRPSRAHMPILWQHARATQPHDVYKAHSAFTMTCVGRLELDTSKHVGLQDTAVYVVRPYGKNMICYVMRLSKNVH